LRCLLVPNADRGITRRCLAAGTARIAENAFFEPREIRQILIDEGITGAAEPVEPVLDVGGVARLRHFSIVDQIDARIGLFSDDLGDRRFHPCRQGICVHGDTFLFGVHRPDKVIRPRQTAGMGGQEAVTAALHG
jgi:hypothetical protein